MTWILSLLHSIWKWILLLFIIAIAGFLFIHFVWKPKPSITLPGGQVINMDTTSFNSAVKQILKKQDDQSKKINDLESAVRQKQNQMVNTDIPEAMKETDIRESMKRIKDHW